MIRLGDDEGSFTVEASMLLPVIVGITMLLLFFCLYSYQKSMLLQIASVSTERAAFNWDNSRKSADGSFAAGEYDSLYWRIGEDNLLSSLFGGGTGAGAVTLELPGEAKAGGALPVIKLQQSAAVVPANLTGEMQYAYALAGRKVSAELKHVLNLPVLDGLLEDGADPKVTARSVVTEPAEFIRTVDLMRYYGAKFKEAGNSKSGTAMDKQDASAMMSKLR
ncbi:pilus assembly protein TadE [Paenibacillus sp. PK3_47]|uniref:TadE/TadG family type IV pilus assembly protein n=1 Tax=Paenibacillus sp. PK3_47 TaxID=2072642 RepID=UPI00201E3D1B|nr:TadE/TadG family type IV pilus assembly protein [Paenibacillus sp. PK3_47]UQZ35219.1 pilus assembly protein TadE [Paenibacillus sp. PK3_47]